MNRQLPITTVINHSLKPTKPIDPRYYQIAILGSGLLYGKWALDFSITPLSIAVILLCAQATQYVFSKIYHLAAFDPKSALISSLSLCLLLRTHSPWLAACAAILAISSKFIIRWRGKHLFNPANFSLVVLMLISPVWVSPGQWGATFFFLFTSAALATVVLTRSRSMDITLAFIVCYALILFSRAAWLGDPFTIPMHNMQNGAFLLFAFFMISDPKTVPDRRIGRFIFAAVVALLAIYIQFYCFNPVGLIYALILCAPLTPLLDTLLPSTRYEWSLSTRTR